MVQSARSSHGLTGGRQAQRRHLYAARSQFIVAMYVRQEAVLSSQIEGTQSSLSNVLASELDPHGQELPRRMCTKIINYVRAMNYGLERKVAPAVTAAHPRDSWRSSDRRPRSGQTAGRLRTSQNWIGAGNVPLARATFIPPPAVEMRDSLDNLERFLHEETSLPILVHCGPRQCTKNRAIASISDSNGRVGRLLITFLLSIRKISPASLVSKYISQATSGQTLPKPTHGDPRRRRLGG